MATANARSRGGGILVYEYQLVRVVKWFRAVMAGLDPAIHALLRDTRNVDARDKPGHDE